MCQRIPNYPYRYAKDPSNQIKEPAFSIEEDKNAMVDRIGKLTYIEHFLVDERQALSFEKYEREKKERKKERKKIILVKRIRGKEKRVCVWNEKKGGEKENRGEEQ